MLAGKFTYSMMFMRLEKGIGMIWWYKLTDSLVGRLLLAGAVMLTAMTGFYVYTAASQPTIEDSYSQAEALGKQHQIDQALIVAQDLAQRAPRDPRMPVLVGQLYRDKHQPDKALDSFQKAHEINPADAEIMQLIGVTQMELKQPDAAEKSLQRAIALEPRNPRPQVTLGIFYHRLAKPALAEKAFSKALSLAPQDPDVHLHLGRLYIKQKQLPKARDQFKAYLGLMDGKDAPDKNRAVAWMRKHYPADLKGIPGVKAAPAKHKPNKAKAGKPAGKSDAQTARQKRPAQAPAVRPSATAQ